jgi:predicted Zn-ribbon and HTH transcriptional regulator
MNGSAIAEIFRNVLSSDNAQGLALSLHHRKVIDAIISCRTPALGGQVEHCDRCGHEIVRFHSCRDRHCPRCQTTARLSWVNDRLRELLPVGYFHVVFTVPHELNPFALRNKKCFYDLLFRAVKETMLELAANPKRLGADIGVVAVLHTWGQALTDHPHIHCIVPGGGYDQTSKRWKPCLNAFLFPVPVIRKLFRGKFIDFFIQAVKTGDITFNGSLVEVADEQSFKALVTTLYSKEWTVYIKHPFASPEALVKYLGAYTHRVAISDSRIVEHNRESVSFAYKDYAHGGERKIMTLAAAEFVRRFLLHVLPEGFKKIRYFGFLAPRARSVRFSRCRIFFSKKAFEPKKGSSPWYRIVKELTGRDPRRCPKCDSGTLYCTATFLRSAALIQTG